MIWSDKVLRSLYREKTWNLGSKSKSRADWQKEERMEDEKEVPHLTLDNFHLDSQVGLFDFGRILLHLTQEKQY